MPSNDIDVFISYAHIDDEPLTEGQKGWITILHNSLQVRLRQLMGSEITIWRDDRLTGNDDFSPEIFKQMEKTGALVSVLSPRYLKSEWCLNEVYAFMEAAKTTGGISIDDSTRIFKVVKTFVPRQEHPRALQNVLGYEFFQLDQSGRPREFLLDPAPDAAKNYWSKVEDLAYDIHNLLKKIHQTGSHQVASSPAGQTGGVQAGLPQATPLPMAAGAAPGPMVYLAESTSDVNVDRDKIRRELVERGCTVLPASPLSLEAGETERQVAEALANASVSIHVLGERFGIVPEGDTRSVARIQYDAAAGISRPGFSRVIWSLPGLQPSDARQQEFIGHVRQSLSSTGEDEYLETNIEELKNFVVKRLTKPVAVKETARAEGPPLVYLICDSKDVEAARPVYDALFEAGVEVVLPAFEGDDAEISKQHKESLTSCDAALLYFGAASEIWVRTKLRDLQKAAGYGRTGEWKAMAVYVAGPPTPAKTLFRAQTAQVIRAGETFSSGELQPFLDLLRSNSEKDLLKSNPDIQ